jgi:hypothetical protein
VRVDNFSESERSVRWSTAGNPAQGYAESGFATLNC